MFFWILSGALLAYAAYLALRLIRDIIFLRGQSRQHLDQLERRLELVEQASWKSRYALPPAIEAESKASRTVKDIDLGRND